MANLYEGQPDARQAEEPIQTSRFRPRYRALDLEEKALHDAIKAKAVEMEDLLAQIPLLRQQLGLPMQVVSSNGLPPPSPARYLALATTDLESAVVNAVKALTS